MFGFLITTCWLEFGFAQSNAYAFTYRIKKAGGHIVKDSLKKIFCPLFSNGQMFILL
jgi:hypothetical protein